MTAMLVEVALLATLCLLVAFDYAGPEPHDTAPVSPLTPDASPLCDSQPVFRRAA